MLLGSGGSSVSPRDCRVLSVFDLPHTEERRTGAQEMDTVSSTDGRDITDDQESSPSIIELPLRRREEAMSNAKEDSQQHDTRPNATYLVEALETLLEVLGARAARLDAGKMTCLVEHLRSFMRNCQKLIEELELRAIVLRTTREVEGNEHLKNFRKVDGKKARSD